MDALGDMALEAYDRAIGLDLADVAVDCCITKAPGGGEKAGRSPVDRGKEGIKRSMMYGWIAGTEIHSFTSGSFDNSPDDRASRARITSGVLRPYWRGL